MLDVMSKHIIFRYLLCCRAVKAQASLRRLARASTARIYQAYNDSDHIESTSSAGYVGVGV